MMMRAALGLAVFLATWTGGEGFLPLARSRFSGAPMTVLQAKSKKGGGKKASGMGKAGFAAGSASDKAATASAGHGAKAQAKAQANFDKLEENDGLTKARVYVREKTETAPWLSVGNLVAVGGLPELKQAAQFHKRLILDHSRLKHATLKSKGDLEAGFATVDEFPDPDEEEEPEAPEGIEVFPKADVADALESGLALDIILAGPMFKRMIGRYGVTAGEMIGSGTVSKGVGEDEEEPKAEVPAPAE